MSNPANEQQHLPTNTEWKTAARSGAYVRSVQQADTLRTGQKVQTAQHVKVDELSAKTESHRKVKRLGAIPAVSGILCFGLLVILGQNSFKALTYKDHFNSGLTALSQGDPDRAQVQFALAVKGDPDSADAYYYLAQAEMQRGSNGNALKNFQKAISLKPNSAKYLQARAVLNLKMHKFQESVEDCAAALKADPAFFDAYRVSANANIHLKQYDNAIADCTKFIENYKAQDAFLADALAKRGFAEDQVQKYEEAIADYTQALTSNPDDMAAVYGGRAVAYMHAKEWDKGVSDCNHALELRPNDAAIFKVRGICHAKLDSHENSLADLDMLVSLRPTIDAHRVRGAQRMAAKDYLGTLEDFDYVLTAQPDDRHVSRKYLTAKTILQSHAPRTAAIADAEPRAKMPSSYDLNKTGAELTKKGYTLFMSGDTEPAIAYFAAATKRDPYNASARRYLAHACMQTERYADAVKQFAAMQNLQLLTRDEKMLQAKALIATDQPSQAIAVYSQLLASEPTNDSLRTSLIKLLLQRGSADDAARLAMDGARQTPAQYAKYNELFRQAVAVKKSHTHVM